MRRNIILGGEPTFADLLHTALVVERNHLVCAVAIEICRRIIEREVAVLTDADASDVNRSFADKILKTRDFRISLPHTAVRILIFRFTVDFIENLKRTRGLSHKALTHITAE